MNDKNMTLAICIISFIGIAYCMAFSLWFMQPQFISLITIAFVLNSMVFMLAITKYNRI